ncbi:hypothetical protein TrispH2_002632 [Trichoplax sp. H2]|nr:hypothetical protein TrispH2_002632 [Trichoplax sp. H2]|eukprot:RDD45411.1 hypothetical protein TrispH2_002632 [Trichoplax sp. H2]
MAYNAKKLIEYESPFWASKLCYIPLATAVAARHLGLSSYLFLRCDEGTQPDVQLLACTGNIFLDSMVGSKIVLLQPQAQFVPDISPRMHRLATHLKSSTGDECYHIPLGGGIFGTYDGRFNNLLEQERCTNEDVMTWAAYQTLMNGEKK